MCFALTGRHFYNVYHEVTGSVFMQFNGELSTRRNRRKLDLRATISVCGQYCLFDGWDFWYLGEELDTIPWNRSLSELLWGDKMWGDLLYCEECATYKPEAAFADFEYEKRTREKYADVIEAFDSTHDYCYYACIRCRARIMMVNIEGREEVFMDSAVCYPQPENRSMGLQRLEGQSSPGESVQPIPWGSRRWASIAYYSNYERWWEIYEALGI